MQLLLYSTNRPRVPLGVITPKLGHLGDKSVLKSNKGTYIQHPCTPWSNTHYSGGSSSMVESRARDRKLVAYSWFNSRSGNVSLCPWKRYFTLISIGAKQSTRRGGPA